MLVAVRRFVDVGRRSARHSRINVSTWLPDTVDGRQRQRSARGELAMRRAPSPTRRATGCSRRIRSSAVTRSHTGHRAHSRPAGRPVPRWDVCGGDEGHGPEQRGGGPRATHGRHEVRLEPADDRKPRRGRAGRPGGQAPAGGMPRRQRGDQQHSQRQRSLCGPMIEAPCVVGDPSVTGRPRRRPGVGATRCDGEQHSVPASP